MALWQIIAIAVTITVAVAMGIMSYLDYRNCPDWKTEHPSVSPFIYVIGQAVLTAILWPVIGIAILIKELIRH